MPIRLLAVLLTILVAAGLVAPVAAASPDVAGVVDSADGAPDLEPVLEAMPVSLDLAVRQEARQIVAPLVEPQGRLHCASLFRPPRSFPSR